MSSVPVGRGPRVILPAATQSHGRGATWRHGARLPLLNHAASAAQEAIRSRSLAHIALCRRRRGSPDSPQLAPMKVKVEEEEADAEQLEVAAILCDMSRLMRARDRRKRRRERERARAAAAFPEIPSWGRRRPRSMPEDRPSPPPSPAPAPAAASPDTPLAYPESGGDDAPPEDKGEVAAAARTRDQVSRPPAREICARAPASAAAAAGLRPLSLRFPIYFERKKKEEENSSSGRTGDD